MIVHVVLVRLPSDLTSEQRRQVLEDFRAAVLGARTVRRARLGRRVRHGRAGYEPAMREDYEFAAILEFDDLDGLTSYLESPAHRKAGAHFAAAAAALAYDYELADVSDDELLLL